MNTNSYLGRGINDYLYAKKSMKDENVYDYNWPAIICSQAVEKILKSVIEAEFADDSSCIALLRTHNLRTVVAKILTKFPESKLSSKDCKWLGDFYYDARYPGDDYITVSKEDAEEALLIVERTLAAVEKILCSEESKQLFKHYKERVSML